MFRRLASHLTDEFAGLGLLYGVMRYRHRPPRRGPASGAGAADLFSGDPAAVFGPLPAAPDLAAGAVTAPAAEAARVHGCGEVIDFAFPSPDVTGGPRTPQFRVNDVVRGRIWRAADVHGPRRCVLALDGIMQAGFGNLRSFARATCPAGVDLATIDLPFNNRRTPAGFRPGQLILGGDLAHVLSVLRQAARDTAAAVRGLTAGGGPPGEYPGGVALAGISFGGWAALQTAALLGSVWKEELNDELTDGRAAGPRWVCGVCPAADLLSALTDGGAIVRAARRNLRLGPADFARLGPVAASVRPATFPRPVPMDGGPTSRVMLHAARYDRFVPNAAVERLAAAWGGDLTWHATGHMGLATAPARLTTVAERWADESLWV